MVSALLHPLGIFIVGLGGGFLIPLLHRLGRRWVESAFVLALAAMTLISAAALPELLRGAPPIEILTGGAAPPYSINLRLGLAEAIAAFGVNLIGLLGGGYLLREKYATLSIYLLPLRLEKTLLVGTTVVFFAVINVVKLVPYAWLDLFDGRNLSTSAALAPIAPIGIFMGYQMMRRVNEVLFYRICYALLFVVGLRLLWEGFNRL